MGLVATFPMQGMQPSRERRAAYRGAVTLPWGGPTGVGLDYPLGSALTLIGGTAQPEIWTLTLGGSGTVTFQFGAERIFQATALSTGTATAAQVLAALQTIWPAWVLPSGSVVGSAGGPFTITFGPFTVPTGVSAQYARIGGSTSFVTTGTATGTLVRTQRGSCGAGQYDYADGVTNTTCNAFLVDAFSSGPTGDLATVPYGPVTDCTFPAQWAWTEGFFRAADSPNLTTAMVNASPRLSFYIGAATTTAGAEVRLLQ